MNKYKKIGLGLLCFGVISGFSLYHAHKTFILKDIESAKKSYTWYDHCNIPTYLKNNKNIKKKMQEYEDYLIRIICENDIRFLFMDEKLQKNEDFIRKLIKKSNNEFYINHISKKKYTGEEFNKLFPNAKLVKYVDESMIHNGFKYEYGVNVDDKDFNTNCECCPGGLYFTNEFNMHKFKYYGKYLFEVKIPDKAKVYIESDDKAKADMIELVRRLN